MRICNIETLHGRLKRVFGDIRIGEFFVYDAILLFKASKTIAVTIGQTDESRTTTRLERGEMRDFKNDEVVDAINETDIYLHY